MRGPVVGVGGDVPGHAAEQGAVGVDVVAGHAGVVGGRVPGEPDLSGGGLGEGEAGGRGRCPGVAGGRSVHLQFGDLRRVLDAVRGHQDPYVPGGDGVEGEGRRAPAGGVERVRLRGGEVGEVGAVGTALELQGLGAGLPAVGQAQDDPVDADGGAQVGPEPLGEGARGALPISGPVAVVGVRSGVGLGVAARGEGASGREVRGGGVGGVHLQFGELGGLPAGVGGDVDAYETGLRRREGDPDGVARAGGEGVRGGALQGGEGGAVGAALHGERLGPALPAGRQLQDDLVDAGGGAQVGLDPLRERASRALPVGALVSVGDVAGAVLGVGARGGGRLPGRDVRAPGRRGRERGPSEGQQAGDEQGAQAPGPSALDSHLSPISAPRDP